MSLRSLSTVAAAYHRHRFLWLFVSLLLTLGAGGTLEELVPRYNPMEVLLAINLLAAIASVAREGRMRLPLALGAAFVVARSLRAALGGSGILALTEVVWITTIVLAIVAAVRYAFHRGAVDREHILAALDAYLLAGLLFAVTYCMLDRIWPGSFRGSAGERLHLGDGIYFSYVTIATLGYGDVIPVSPPARGLAMVETVSGQMYLTVLVARLVSLFSRHGD